MDHDPVSVGDERVGLWNLTVFWKLLANANLFNSSSTPDPLREFHLVYDFFWQFRPRENGARTIFAASPTRPLNSLRVGVRNEPGIGTPKDLLFIGEVYSFKPMET